MNSAISEWIPSEVLVGSLALALGVLYKLVLNRATKTELALDKLAIAIEAVREEQHAMRLVVTTSASIEQLGRLGDRLDSRITSAESKIAVAMDRYDRTEQSK